MSRFLGMNGSNGRAIEDIAHLRQSVSDILLTPQGSRLVRRAYGSLLFELMDQPQNPALRLQMMAAVYTALTRWEPRLTLSSVAISSSSDGSMVVDIIGQQASGQSVSLSINTGVQDGRY